MRIVVIVEVGTSSRPCAEPPNVSDAATVFPHQRQHVLRMGASVVAPAALWLEQTVGRHTLAWHPTDVEPQPEEILLTSIRNHWNDLDWRDDATCRDLDPDLFFPVGVTGMAVEQIEAAKSFCTNCASLEACLEFAITTNQEYGVWGGTTEDERRVLRRQWRAEVRRQRIAS